MGLRGPSMRGPASIAKLGLPHPKIASLFPSVVSYRAAIHTKARAAAGPSVSSRDPYSVLSLFRSRPRRSTRTRVILALGWIPVAAFITSHVCSIGNVTGASMSPTFNGPREEALAPGAKSDVVLLNRSVQASHNYKVGDIVTLISPLEPRLLLTKRIIALPDDMVRTWAPAADDAKSAKGKGRWTRIKVPRGHVWVEGDAAVDIAPTHSSQITSNAATVAPAWVQTKSRDSREFGPVPMGLITSRISYILWPPRRFGRPASRPVPESTNRNQYPPSASSADSTADVEDLLEDFATLATQVSTSLSRALDNRTNAPYSERTKAHPQDSVLSPYIDWDDEHHPPAAERQQDATAAAEKQHRLKHMWNNLSRGGKLGDDAA